MPLEGFISFGKEVLKTYAVKPLAKVIAEPAKTMPQFDAFLIKFGKYSKKAKAYGDGKPFAMPTEDACREEGSTALAWLSILMVALSASKVYKDHSTKQLMVVVEEKVETKVQEEIGKLEPKVRNKVKSDLQEELKEELKKEILDELKEEEKHRDVVIFKPFG